MTPSGSKARSGFALVLTIGLLALLVLAVYALSALVRANAQTATAGVAQMQARQNALLGLDLAIAELQRYAGQDGRVTAKAGVTGVPATDVKRQWTGVWSGSGAPRWLVSGSSQAAAPAIVGSSIRLVGKGSVGEPTDRTDQELVEVGLINVPGDSQNSEGGRIAYWVGDEGAKVSAAVLPTEVQSNSSGATLRPDTRRLLGSGFDPVAASVAKLTAFEQIASGFSVNLPVAFHNVSLKALFLPSSVPGLGPRGGNYVAGAFNINTSSSVTWRAWFEFPSSSSTATTNLSLSASQSLRLSQRVSSAIAARGAPFMSPSDLAASRIIDAALNTSPRVTGITEAQILDAISAAFAVRSDTFRIRAYGEVVNPADGTTVEAVAYCEAIVQRTPDTAPNGLGRRFVVTYFRWLGPGDI